MTGTFYVHGLPVQQSLLRKIPKYSSSFINNINHDAMYNSQLELISAWETTPHILNQTLCSHLKKKKNGFTKSANIGKT